MMTKKEIAAATGINPRTILDWQTRGYLRPVVPAQGQGTIPQYDKAGIVQALVLKTLSAHGISLSRFSKIFHGQKPVSTLEVLGICLYDLESQARKKGITVSDELDSNIVDLLIYDDCRRITIDQWERTNPVCEKDSEDFEIKLVIRLNPMIKIAFKYDYM